MDRKGRIAVFISGRGSNLESIYRESQSKNAKYKIEVVISDNPMAKGVNKSKEYNIETFVFERNNFKRKKDFEKAILNILLEKKIELICLAGYMRIVGKTLLGNFKGKIINIHPSLLPAFPGIFAQKQAFDYGVKITGCTVHFVDAGIDTGKIIAQTPVRIEPEDTLESLSKKILKQEHELYPNVINDFFETKEEN